eukprot:gnl/TRDRNA2_/TRDRNA2_151803_c0_seq3.p1 gnl/TRDRNA2_/TRDRNA2_151803_c0~~gnl/TRDRNA2_/TRDRNA2_151803_c0_seq3.p1  ORF type:complete len:252 (+),score=10.04 gnl/TRDRNA2_/TRDRNA2_151803_c0_seq3:145-900(+)
MFHFAKDPLPEALLGDLDKWRQTDGNIVYDVSNNVTLSSRVCSSDSSLSLATAQAQIFSQLSSYSNGKVQHGPMLCFVVLIIWTMSILSELLCVFHFLCAVLMLPREPRTRIQDNGKDLKLVAVSRNRVIVLTIVAMLQIIIGVILLVCGSIWLLHTTSVQDLILNAAALEFVLNIDELFYRVFSPARITALISQLQPLPLPRKMWAHSALEQARPLGPVVILALFVLPLLWARLLPQLDRIERVKETLCT